MDNEDDIIQAYKMESQSAFLRTGSHYNLESSIQILVNLAILFKNEGVSLSTAQYLERVVEHLSPELCTVHPELLNVLVKKLDSIMKANGDLGMKLAAGVKVSSGSCRGLWIGW